MENGEKKKVFSNMQGAQNNWFLTPQQSAALSDFSESTRRLNDLDSNMIEEKTSIKTQEEPLTLEYRIEEKERIIKDLDSKIKANENIANNQELISLRMKKQRISQELRDLYKEYNTRSLAPKVLDGTDNVIVNLKQRKMPVINAMKRFIKRYVLANISSRFKSLVVLGDSLDTLEAINRNVDELMKMKTPYGETAQNYQKLTEYLYRAHKIRAQINKSIKK